MNGLEWTQNFSKFIEFHQNSTNLFSKNILKPQNCTLLCPVSSPHWTVHRELQKWTIQSKTGHLARIRNPIKTEPDEKGCCFNCQSTITQF